MVAFGGQPANVEGWACQPDAVVLTTYSIVMTWLADVMMTHAESDGFATGWPLTREGPTNPALSTPCKC